MKKAIFFSKKINIKHAFIWQKHFDLLKFLAYVPRLQKLYLWPTQEE